MMTTRKRRMRASKKRETADYVPPAASPPPPPQPKPMPPPLEHPPAPRIPKRTIPPDNHANERVYTSTAPPPPSSYRARRVAPVASRQPQPRPQVRERYISVDMTSWAVPDPSGFPQECNVSTPMDNNSDVVLGMTACSVSRHDVLCGSGVYGAVVRSDVRDDGTVSFPYVPGHAVVGRVSDIGDFVENFELGQRVCAVWLSGFDCFPWLKGAVVPLRVGGLSNRLLANSSVLVPVPDALPADIVCSMLAPGCAALTALMHVFKLRLISELLATKQNKHTIGVVGFGVIGYMVTLLIRALGHEVIVFSTSESKRHTALGAGASAFYAYVQAGVGTQFNPPRPAQPEIDLDAVIVCIGESVIPPGNSQQVINNLDLDPFLISADPSGSGCIIIGPSPSPLSSPSPSMPHTRTRMSFSPRYVGRIRVLNNPLISASVTEYRDRVNMLMNLACLHPQLRLPYESGSVAQMSDVWRSVMQGMGPVAAVVKF